MAEPAASSALVLEPRKHCDQALVAEVWTLRSVDVDFREHRFADEAFADGFGEMAGETNVVITIFFPGSQASNEMMHLSLHASSSLD